MRHFGHIAPEVRQRLFHQEPCEFTADSPARTARRRPGRHALQPGHPPAARRRHRQAGRPRRGLDGAVPGGLHRRRGGRGGRGEPGPAVRRPRRARRTRRAAAAVHPGPHARADPRPRTPARPAVRLLSGFVLPKFTEERGVPFLEALTDAEAASGRRLFAHAGPGVARAAAPRDARGDPGRASPAPSTSTASGSSRCASASPTSAPSYGLRRAPDMTAYDVQIVASVIADVVNVLGRADGTGFTVTGPGVGVLPRSRSACSSRSCAAAPSWRAGPRSCATR